MSHDPIPALGWGAMTMDMEVVDLDPTTVPLNFPVEFDLTKDADGMFAIAVVRAADAPAEPTADAPPARRIEATGTITALHPETGMATISHGPMKAIGMPGMTMDFAVSADLDPAALPIGQEAALGFVRQSDMSLVLEEVTVAPAAGNLGQ